MISIIVAVYNLEKYIERMAASLMQQTYTDLEILLIDDGSTDRSPEICDRLAEQDSRIRVIHTENQGVAMARRVGFCAASGDELMFADGDDYVAPDFVEKLHRAREESNADMAICNFYYVDEDTKEMRRPVLNYVSDGVINAQDALYLYSAKWTDTFYMSVLWNKIYRKEVFREEDFYGEKHHSDSYQVPNAIARSKTIRVIPDCLYYYIARGNSLVHTKNLQRINALHRAQIWKAKFMEEHGAKEAAMAVILKNYATYRRYDPAQLEERFDPKQMRRKYCDLYFHMPYTSDLSRKDRFGFFLALLSFQAYRAYGRFFKKTRVEPCAWEPLNIDN